MEVARFHARTGFSLVELSIVLVILGLLVGGVLSGQSLIRAAELRSVTTDFSRYATAINTFRDKYFALPGDITNATQFWGIAGGAAGNDAACYTVVSTDTKTCNGNGNGHLFFDDNAPDLSAPEWFRAWQHLANAGLVEGHYTGVASSPVPRTAQPGVNVPAARMSGGGFTIMSFNPADWGNIYWWPGHYDGFFFGAAQPQWESSGAILKPEDAWNIDTKLDDGKPSTGFLRDLISVNFDGACNTTSVAATALYNVADGDIHCSLFFAVNPPGNS